MKKLAIAIATILTSISAWGDSGAHSLIEIMQPTADDAPTLYREIAKGFGQIAPADVGRPGAIYFAFQPENDVMLVMTPTGWKSMRGTALEPIYRTEALGSTYTLKIWDAPVYIYKNGVEAGDPSWNGDSSRFGTSNSMFNRMFRHVWGVEDMGEVIDLTDIAAERKGGLCTYMRTNGFLKGKFYIGYGALSADAEATVNQLQGNVSASISLQHLRDTYIDLDMRQNGKYDTAWEMDCAYPVTGFGDGG